MTLDIDDKTDVLSIHKEYPIKDFNWTLEFLFTQGEYTKDDIFKVTKVLSPLLNIGDRAKLSTLLKSDTYNSALSVSDKGKKKSFMILTQVTSMSQFMDSLVHEMLHLSRHIDECGNNENLFTILGDIAGDIIKELYLL